MPTVAVKLEEKKEPQISTDVITKMARGISGYYRQAEDPKGANLADGLGCTLSGYTGVTQITSVEDALAIRLAARKKTEHSMYVICNLGRMERDKKQLGYLLGAGWKILQKMPGAHSKDNPTATLPSYSNAESYESCLMGARTAKTEEELMKMVEEELKLEDEAQFPVKGKEKKPVAKPKHKLPD